MRVVRRMTWSNETMMYPEMMHIIVAQYQESLRALARDEPIVPEADHLAHSGRRYLGTAMIRFGSWLGGCVPTLSQPTTMSPQEP